MSAAWSVIAALALATIALKAAGPVMVGEREPTPRILAVTGLLAPALVAGLVVYETLGAADGPGLELDARLGGLAAAAGALALRLPLVAVVGIAAAATAALRLLT